VIFVCGRSRLWLHGRYTAGHRSANARQRLYGATEIDAVDVHHEVDYGPSGGALPAQPSVLGNVDGEPIRARALPAVATDRTRADELEPDPPQRDAAAVDFIDNRHSTGAGDGFSVEAACHDAPPSTSGSSL
jgi:hypothetical protein